MAFSNPRARLVFAGAALLAASACNGNNAVPPGATATVNSSQPAYASGRNPASPVDTTSILKKLTKDVEIGSTVDPTDGDKGPHALSVVKVDYVLKEGQLLVCNFEDKASTAGAGTTIDVFNPTAGSKATTFVESKYIEGCDGDAIDTGNSVYGTAMTSHMMARISPRGSVKKVYTSPLEVPFDSADAPPKPGSLYEPEFMFASDAKTGSIVSLDLGIEGSGAGNPIQVATGFGVNAKTGWSALGPSGLQYDSANNTLYIADGVDNTVVMFTYANELLAEDEIVVQPGGKTFKCKYAKPCGKLVLAGSPLDAPEAMTLLPNGNLIVANTAGGNTLVELTPTGQVLDTKVVDSSKTAGVFGLVAVGTTDDNTVLYYTDSNSNTLQELEQ
jgi:hypothetical protein